MKEQMDTLLPHDKDIKAEKDCTHLVPPRVSYSIEEYERLAKEATEILHEIELHCFQMTIDIAPYAGNALLDDDAEQMEFFKGFHRALVMMRKYIDEKRKPLLLKEYDAEQNQQTYSDYVKEQLATLLPHDHRLLDEIVRGLCEEGWVEKGGSPTYRLLDKQGAAIKIFRDAEAPQVIRICFSAEPEIPEPEEPKVDKPELRTHFTKKAVKVYIDKCISYWRNSDAKESQYYVDAYQSVRRSLFGELKPPEKVKKPSGEGGIGAG